MSAWAADLGWALLHSLWQVTVVAGLLWALLTLLHRASPRLRHALALGALLLAAAWPASTCLQRRQARAARMTALAQAPRPALPLAPATPEPSPLPDLSPALPWLGAFWICGALAMGLRLAGGGWWLLRLRTRTSPAPADLIHRAGHLARRMGLHAPELRLLPEAQGPFCYGLFRTVVVLPAACLAALDADLLEALLAHEFAHLKRRDFLLGGLQAGLDLLLFHHPLARWISSQARLERERACDEAAAAACGDARTIARALLELEDLRPPLAALAAQGAPLIPRIHALLGRSPRPTPLASLAASLLLGSAALTLAAAPLQTPPSSIQAPAALIRLADEAARIQGLDPYLVRAVIQVESRFNPAARSPLGALGLMQVMPATAERLGEKPSTAPEANLRAGTRYLRQLLDRYHGDTAKALMAYNAGPEALDRAEGVAPTEESRNYALAVLDLYRRKAVETR